MTSNYTYDPLYELTQVTQNANTTESYTYDPVGNRLSSLGVSPYVNNTSNELTSTPNASYSYDYNGNTTSKTVSAGTTNYTWDYENRLASVTLPGTSGSITFKYDPFGRRVQKAFTQNSTTTTTNYLYDGSNAVGDIDQNGNVLARYAETQNIDEPLAELRSGTTSYYEVDGLGSVTSLTSGAGAIADTYTYDSFGNVTASTGSVTNRFQYTAREFDSESGLYYYRARYYDPNLGRFASEDPFKEVVRGLNFYEYVRNHPPDYTDPTGRSPWDWWDKFWRWLGLGKSSWNAAADTMDWSLCGLYYVNCVTKALGIKEDLARALNSPDPVVSATAIAQLAQQTGSNTMSQLNLNVCIKNDENCYKALMCAQKGLTNPLPFPVTVPVTW